MTGCLSVLNFLSMMAHLTENYITSTEKTQPSEGISGMSYSQLQSQLEPTSVTNAHGVSPRAQPPVRLIIVFPRIMTSPTVRPSESALIRARSAIRPVCSAGFGEACRRCSSRRGSPAAACQQEARGPGDQRPSPTPRLTWRAGIEVMVVFEFLSDSYILASRSAPI